MNLFMAIAFLTKTAPAATFVGGRVAAITTTEAYPAGTTTGDLVIAVTHSSAVPGTPSGFTSVFTTSGDLNGYSKRVSYKISAGETTCDLSGGSNGFDQTLVTLRGRTSVSATHGWGYSTTTSQSLSVAVTGTAILIASDRGGTSAPSLTTTPDATFNAASAYFQQKTGVYLSSVSGTSYSFTDVSDAYGTSGLLIIAT